jgi:hypothetical protein
MDQEIKRLETLLYLNRRNKDLVQIYTIELGKLYRELMFEIKCQEL